MSRTGVWSSSDQLTIGLRAKTQQGHHTRASCALESALVGACRLSCLFPCDTLLETGCVDRSRSGHPAVLFVLNGSHHPTACFQCRLSTAMWCSDRVAVDVWGDLGRAASHYSLYRPHRPMGTMLEPQSIKLLAPSGISCGRCLHLDNILCQRLYMREVGGCCPVAVRRVQGALLCV